MARKLAGLLFVLLMTGSSGGVAWTAQDTPDYGGELDRLSEKLNVVEYELSAAWLPRRQLQSLRQRTNEVLARAVKIRKKARKQVEYYKRLVEALGPAPDERKPPEAPDIATERQRLNSKLASFQGFAKKANVISVKATELLEQIAATTTRTAASELLERQRSIWDSKLWAAAAAELNQIALGKVDLLPTRPNSVRWGSPGALVWAALGISMLILLTTRLMLAQWSRHLLSTSLSRHFDKFGILAIQLVVKSFLPVVLAGGSSLLLRNLSIYPPVGEDLLLAFLVASFACLYTRDIGETLFSGNRRWLNSGDDIEAKIDWRITMVAWLVAGSLFFYITGRRLTISTELLQVVQIGLRTTIAILFLAIVSLLLRPAEVGHPAASPRSAASALRARKRSLARTGLALGLTVLAMLAVFNPILIALGYMALTDWMFVGLFWTAVLISGAILARAIASGLIAATLQRLVRPLWIIVGRRPMTRRRTRLLQTASMGVGNLLIGGVLLYAMLRLWGVDLTAASVWSYKLVDGVKIGNLEISLFDLIAALVVVGVVLGFTRLLQRLLARQLLPHTRLDPGARSALQSGTRYLGLLVGLTLGLATLGVDLTKLALVLGGLAVGIGFGLQHIANNILSGLVMLAERPLKPGDWVILNGHEGFVHRVSLRATELRNFRNASVIVPNAEVVSGTVVNWTHKDRSACIILSVVVDLDSNENVVNEILMRCAREHPLILSYPPPQIYVRSVSAIGLRYELWAHISNATLTDRVQSELYKSIAARLRAARVKLSPTPEEWWNFQTIANTCP